MLSGMETILGKAPDPPDPYATSAAQTASNEQTAAYNAQLNRVNQVTPYGSSTYTANTPSQGTYDPYTGTYTGGTDGGAPQYTQTITLTPLAQDQLNNQLKQNNALSNIGFGLADQAQNSLQGKLDTSQLPSIQGGPAAGNVQSSLDYSNAPGLYGVGDPSQSAKDTANAVYSQYTSRLDPQWANSDAALQSQLANQGVVQGSEAYNKAMTQQAQAKNDAYAQAQYNSVNAGNAQQQQLYNQSLASRQQAVNEANTQGGFANSAEAQAYAQALQAASANNAARAQGLTEQTQLQSLPLNQLNALRSGTQINNPTFGSVPQANAANTDVSGNINSAYQAQVANANNTMSGLFGLGSAVLSAGLPAGFLCDRRLKTDILRVGTSPVMRLPLYAFRYLGMKYRHVGVMAQDVLKVAPWAVKTQPDGYMAVNYGMLS